MTIKPENQSKFQPISQKWLERALCLTVFFIAGAVPTPHVNEAHYLCRLKSYWDPSWCSGDLFLDSPEAHLTVVWLFGWMTYFFSLSTIAWIGRLISWSLVAFAWQKLSFAVLPRDWFAPLSAALMLVGTEQTHLAGEWIIGGFEAKSLAYGFVLLGLGAAVSNRWNLAWIQLGIASAMHALVGGWSVLALMFAKLSCTENRSFKSFSSMMPGLLIGGTIGMLGVLPALFINQGIEPKVIREADQIYVFFRLPHHLAILNKDADWILERGFRHAIILALFIITQMQLRKIQLPNPYALYLVRRFALGALFLSIIGFTIHLIGWSNPAWSASLLKYYWWRLADIALPVAVSLSLAVIVANQLKAQSRRAIVTLVGCLALATWGIGKHTLDRLEARDVPPADMRMRDHAAWLEVCDWASENTQSTDLFLVPQSTHTFKWNAGRPDVASYKDIPQDAESMVEWHRRLHDVFHMGYWEDGTKRWAPSLSALGTQKLIMIANRYGASYAISQNPLNQYGYPIQANVSLPVIYRKGPYTVYDLRRYVENSDTKATEQTPSADAIP